MAESMIRWKKGDYITLGKAIANFNRTIKKLEKEEKGLKLPNYFIYEEEKARIKTRTELNRFIKSIKKISEEGAFEPVQLEGGLVITNWEFKDLRQKAKTTKMRLNKELGEIDHVGKPYETQQELTIKANLKAISNWKKLSRTSI